MILVKNLATGATLSASLSSQLEKFRQNYDLIKFYTVYRLQCHPKQKGAHLNYR